MKAAERHGKIMKATTAGISQNIKKTATWRHQQANKSVTAAGQLE